MASDKTQFYQLVTKQLTSLLAGERYWVTNLSQFCALINTSLDDINWVGFYLNRNDDSLVLGPFQGNVACVEIPFGKGVCGTSAAEIKTLVVDDVDQFSGHIACDARSRSEIVVPLQSHQSLVGVLDIDSPSLHRFDGDDVMGLQRLVEILVESTDWPQDLV